METKAPASNPAVRQPETNATPQWFPSRKNKADVFSLDLTAEEKNQPRMASTQAHDATKASKTVKPPRVDMSDEASPPRNEGIASPDANIPSFASPTAPKLTVQQSSLRRVPLAEKLDLLVLGSNHEIWSASPLEAEDPTFEESNSAVQPIATLTLSIEALEASPNSKTATQAEVLAAGMKTPALGMFPEWHGELISEPVLGRELNRVEQDLRHSFRADRKQPEMGAGQQSTKTSVHVTDLATHFAPPKSPGHHPELANSSLPSTEAKVERQDMQLSSIERRQQSSTTLPIELDVVPLDQAQSSSPAQVVAQVGSNIVGELKSIAPPQPATNSFMPNPGRPEEPSKLAGVVRTLSIELYPASLGEVRVDLQLREGQLRVKLGATKVQAKHQIEQELKTLVQMLCASGYEVSELLIETVRFAERDQLSEPSSQRLSNTSPGLASGQGFQNEHARRHQDERGAASESSSPKREQLDTETPPTITRRIVV